MVLLGRRSTLEKKNEKAYRTISPKRAPSALCGASAHGDAVQYLRCGLVEVPPPLSLEGTLAEAEFFLCESLAAELHAHIAERDAPPPLSPLPTVHLHCGGVYVHSDPADPTLTEAFRFTAAASDQLHTDPSQGAGANSGAVVYSRGPSAVENVVALDAMISPLPRLWRENVGARTLIARFTQSFIARGTFHREGGALMITCGEIAESTDMPIGQQLLVGLAQPDGVLLLLSEVKQPATMALDFGLASVDARAALGGGFRRFQYQRSS